MARIATRQRRAASSCRSAPSATRHRSTSLSGPASPRACEPNRMDLLQRQDRVHGLHAPLQSLALRHQRSRQVLQQQSHKSKVVEMRGRPQARPPAPAGAWVRDSNGCPLRPRLPSRPPPHRPANAHGGEAEQALPRPAPDRERGHRQHARHEQPGHPGPARQLGARARSGAATGSGRPPWRRGQAQGEADVGEQGVEGGAPQQDQSHAVLQCDGPPRRSAGAGKQSRHTAIRRHLGVNPRPRHDQRRRRAHQPDGDQRGHRVRPGGAAEGSRGRPISSLPASSGTGAAKTSTVFRARYRAVTMAVPSSSARAGCVPGPAPRRRCTPPRSSPRN